MVLVKQCFAGTCVLKQREIAQYELKKVEGKDVGNLLLDTSSSQTWIQQEWSQRKRREKQ